MTEAQMRRELVRRGIDEDAIDDVVSRWIDERIDERKNEQAAMTNAFDWHRRGIWAAACGERIDPTTAATTPYSARAALCNAEQRTWSHLEGNGWRIVELQVVQPTRTTPEYVAGGTQFFYPAAGDPKPPGGAKVQLLTRGGVTVHGTWNDSGAFMGWCPLPKRNKEKEATCASTAHRAKTTTA